MDKKVQKEIAEIEETQCKLRESIEVSRKLAEQTDELLRAHKETLKA